MEFHGYILSRMLHRWFEPRIVRPPLNYLSLRTSWWQMLNFSGLECHASVWVCGSRAKYGQLSYKTHQKNIKEPRSWACCVVGRCWEHELLAGQLGQVRVLKWMLCLIQLAFCSISSTRNYLDPSASWQANLHPAHYCTNLKLPQAPQIARTNQRLWWFVVINHAKLEVPTLTHTHAPTRFSQLPFWAPSKKVVPFNIFQPIFSHLSAIHSFWKQTSGMVRALCASQCHPGPPLEVLVRSAWPRSGLDPGAVLGRGGCDFAEIRTTWAGLKLLDPPLDSLDISWYFQTYLLQRTWFFDFGSWSLSPTLKYGTSLHPKFLGLSYGLSGSGTSGSGAWPGAYGSKHVKT